jgi:hypothetical protein
MQENQPHGRTAWDFLIVAIKSKLMVALAIVFFAIFPAWVGYQAEPGSEVSLYGGFYKYQKPKTVPAIAPTQPSSAPSTKDYVLPKYVDLQEQPTPVLDGTINIARTSDGKFGSFYMSGVNIDTINFAIRTPSGESTPPILVGNQIYVSPTDAVVELEYKGNFFRLQTENQKGDEGTFVFSITPTQGATMKLKNMKQYSAGG